MVLLRIFLDVLFFISFSLMKSLLASASLSVSRVRLPGMTSFWAERSRFVNRLPEP